MVACDLAKVSVRVRFSLPAPKYIKGNKVTENKKQDTTILIDGAEYDTENFTQQQILLVNHCIDLTRKIDSSKFQLYQLEVAKDAFLAALKADLNTTPDETETAS